MSASGRIRRAWPSDRPVLLSLWRRAVEATHAFLSPAEIDLLEPEVAELLSTSDAIEVIEAQGAVLGFALVQDDRLEALFIDPGAHRQGWGRRLLRHAGNRGARSVEVNEENGGARAFYEAHGCVVTGRTSHDSAGRPWPVLTLNIPSL